MKKIVSALILLLLSSSSDAREMTQDEHRSAIDPTSIISLIATPEKFDGKWVSVEGYLSTGFEDSTLYLTKDLALNGLKSNAIFVSYDRSQLLISPNTISSLKQAHHNYVLIYGQFDRRFRRLAKVKRVFVFGKI